jgi:hypothetical protein
MIKFPTIPEEKCTVVNPKGVSRLLNELEFRTLQIKICKKQEKGWYGFHLGEKFYINKFGICETWPKKMFNKTFKLAHEHSKLIFSKKYEQK